MVCWLKRWLPGFLIIILVTLPASATETVTFDGVWWQSLSRVDKDTAVQGMLAGYVSGYYRAKSDAGDAVFSKAKSLTMGQSVGIYNLIVSQQPPSMNAAFGTIIDRINDLYADHPETLKDATAYYIACAASDSGDCAEAIKAVHRPR